MTSFMDVFSARRRSITVSPAFDPRKKWRSPWKRSQTVNAFTLIRDSRFGVSVLKSSRTRATLKLAGPQRFIFAEITIDLPSPQPAAGVHDLPVVATEDFLQLWGCCVYNGSATQATVSSGHRCRITRHQNPASGHGIRSKG